MSPTRRDLIKTLAALGAGSVVPALPETAPTVSQDEETKAGSTEYRLFGTVTLYDPSNKVMLMGKIAFLSDGASRSEIVISNDDSGDHERLIFTGETNCQWVCCLIDRARETYSHHDIWEV